MDGQHGAGCEFAVSYDQTLLRDHALKSHARGPKDANCLLDTGSSRDVSVQLFISQKRKDQSTYWR